MTAIAAKGNTWRKLLGRLRTYFSKPQNVILLVLGIVLTVSTIAPMLTIVNDTFAVHEGSVDARNVEEGQIYTTFNWVNLFAPATKTQQRLAQINLWTPLLNSVLLSVFSCIGAILFGGVFAYLVTRTNMKCKKYLSAIFIFPYIMPQWTMAVVWKNLFDSNLITGGSDGLLASLFGLRMPLWWCEGLFPSAMVLSLHYGIVCAAAVAAAEIE